MASLNTIARPYAKAVFELARESRTLSEWRSVLHVLELAIEDVDLVHLLKNPTIQSSDWMQLLMSLCEKTQEQATRRISDSLANLLALLLEYKRLPVLGEIAKLFHALHLKEEGVVEVDVSSPFPITEKEEADFRRMLKKYFGDATIRLQTNIDPSLIGGALLRCGDWVIDGSIKRKLARLRESLSQNPCFEEIN
jgi:F-type H+-transporting ATPase subunit delta